MPDVSALRVWGSKAFSLKPPSQQRGFNAKTSAGIMVGYAAGGRGYRIYLPTTQKIVERRDVLMDETPGSQAENKVRWDDEPAGADAPGGVAGPPATPQASPGATPTLTPSSSGKSTAPAGTPGIDAEIEAARRMTLPPSEDESEEDPDPSSGRYPGRTREPPLRLGGHGAGAGAAHIMAAPGGELAPSRENLPPPPRDVKEARNREDWPLSEAAQQVEQGSMVRNKVWLRQKARNGTRPLKTKVVFEYKCTQGGKLDRRKCRLVALGCRQRPGRDYHETWAPVPSAATTRGLLATGAARCMHVHLVDVNTAYLNADMDVDVYLVIPDGFTDAGEEALVCKAIYATKQAGRLWAIHFSKALTSFGAVRSEADACLYVMSVDGQVVVEVHVDDILVTGRDLFFRSRATSHTGST